MEQAIPFLENFEVAKNEKTTIMEYDGFEWEVAYDYEPQATCNTDRGTQFISECYSVYKIGNIFGINVTDEFEREQPGICELLSEKLTEQFKNK